MIKHNSIALNEEDIKLPQFINLQTLVLMKDYISVKGNFGPVDVFALKEPLSSCAKKSRSLRQQHLSGWDIVVDNGLRNVNDFFNQIGSA